MSVNNVDCKRCATLPAHKKLLSVVDKGRWEGFKSVTSISVRGHYCLAQPNLFGVHCYHLAGRTHFSPHHSYWAFNLKHFISLLAIHNCGFDGVCLSVSVLQQEVGGDLPQCFQMYYGGNKMRKLV